MRVIGGEVQFEAPRAAAPLGRVNGRAHRSRGLRALGELPTCKV
jgi:hypothetical protein